MTAESEGAGIRPMPGVQRIVRTACAAAAVLFAAGISAQTSSTTRITADNVAFLYESRAAVPAPDHRLAEIVSVDYRRARDEFTRHDLFARIEPVIRERLREGLATGRVHVVVRIELEEYDFDLGAFPTGFGGTGYLDFRAGHRGGPAYRVRFANGGELARVPVPVDAARGLAGQLRRSRDADMRIEGVPGRAVEEGGSKTLYLTATRMELSLRGGTAVAAVDLAAPPGDG